jgi:hypothetical protein
MPTQNYQVRGPSSRSVLITIRVSPEERALLGQLAEERGETLSRLMVSRSLMLRKRANPQKPAPQATAADQVAISASACAPEQSAPARPEAKPLRDASVIAGQESLFDDEGGR